MRVAKTVGGSHLLNRDEYVSTQQIQSIFFFFRPAAKSSQDQATDLSEPDVTAAQEQQTMDVTRQGILHQVYLRCPIVYDHLDTCALYKGKRLLF